jgi:hypothetical protein
MATSAFGKAFRAARDAGEKEFTFNGTKYNTRYAEEEKPKTLRDLGYDASGKPAPLKIPKLSNKVEKEDLDEKGRLGNAMMRAEIGDEELPTAKYAPKRFGKEGIKISSPADEGLEKYMPRKVSTKESLSPGEEAMKRGGKVKSSASKRGDGIATKGFTKGRYI